MKTTTLSERARPQTIAAALRREILRGDYTPGDRLRERQLADRFEVSRGPVREALRLLAADRLVEFEAYRGARVVRLTLSEIIEMFELRAALVALAARLAADRADDAAIARFEQAVDKLAAMAEARATPAELVAQGGVAANILVEAANASLLKTLVDQVGRISRWHYTQVGLTNLAAALEAARNWRAVAEPLRARNPDAAEAALKHALRFVQERALQALIQQQGPLVGKAPRRG